MNFFALSLVTLLATSGAYGQYCSYTALYSGTAAGNSLYMASATLTGAGALQAGTAYSGWAGGTQYCTTTCIGVSTTGSCGSGYYSTASASGSATSYGANAGYMCAASTTCPSGSFTAANGCTYTYNCSSPSCFPATSTVQTLSRGVVSITDVKEGDMLRAYSTQSKSEVFSRFTGYSHADAATYAKFLELTTASKTIKLSELHLIAKASGEFVYAKDVQVNDRVLVAGGQSEAVVRIEETIERGVYAPLTEEGTVVVDGVVASCYANYASHELAHMVHPYLTVVANFVNAFLGYKDTTEMAQELGLYAALEQMPFSGSLNL